MRVVVLGATGNVGTSVVEALSNEPDVSVLGVSRRLPELDLPHVEWAAADITSSDLVPLFRGADCVVHLAWLIQPARDQEAVRATNIHGSTRVFEAVAEAGVPALVYASSVGAYSPGPKKRFVDENWPTEGIRTSFYSRHKAEVERILDAFERDRPETRVVRLRPGLIFKREAASGIRRLFAGPFLPSPLVRPALVPFVPDTPRLRFQAVHSRDVGDAYRLAVVSDARGAFNVAADPVLDPAELVSSRCPARCCAEWPQRPGSSTSSPLRPAGSTWRSASRCSTPRAPAPSSAGRLATAPARRCSSCSRACASARERRPHRSTPAAAVRPVRRSS
jgi:nucleoside-diphosphate-sugar epimerase